MGSKRIEEDFEIKWLETFNEVSEYHRNFYGGQMISLSLPDLKKLVEGKFLAWSSGFDEYSEVLYLNEDAKKVLNKIVKGESSC
ncbi:hypothetical protein Q4433_08270 [Streptococcus parasanguinis]|uniref:hypothetical protein n=1 Tax=Streptococcus parasanguinis TaxID=1318 RepID=UPI0026E17D8B|nr:hypothetical protein [Streptococcus parasanguinis]MDO6230838.1 hypothetical protein [Streptococcus parasanguinis]